MCMYTMSKVPFKGEALGFFVDDDDDDDDGVFLMHDTYICIF